MIISIHTPKSGGTSTLKMYQDAFGADNVLSDRVDDPGDPCDLEFQATDAWMDARPTELSENIKVVHGHFRPVKYDLISDPFWVTFLRHPVDNIISMHNYWKVIPEQPNSLHRKFKQMSLDVTDFAKLETLRYLYSRTYFGGWDMGKMSFVGSHENRVEDLIRLGSLLGVEFDTSIYANRTEQSKSDAPDPKTIEKLKDILIDDIKFYDAYVNRQV